MDGMDEKELTSLLLGDTPLDNFWRDNWNKGGHWVSGRSADTFDACVRLDELENMISHTRLPLGNFDLAQDQKPLEKTAYCENGFISSRRVCALHEAGATIILRAAHYWLPGLDRLRIACEAMFGCPVQANVYLTPPDNQSTPPHWDTHDLFVLQIAGSKRWPLFENLNNPRPLSEERFQPDIDPIGALAADIELKAGDCLYLPRGEIHAPVSTGYSVHVALGVSAYRWIDVLQAAMHRPLPADSFLRQTVPPQGMTVDLAEQVGAARKAMKTLASRDILAEFATTAALAHMGGDSTPPAGWLSQIAGHDAQLCLADHLSLVAHARLEVSEKTDRAYLVAGEKSASFPASQKNGLKWLTQTAPVTPTEFADKMGWDAETGLAVANSLVDEGLVCRA